MKNLRRVDCSLLVVAVIYATAIDIAGLRHWWEVPFAVVIISALYIPSRWTWRLPGRRTKKDLR